MTQISKKGLLCGKAKASSSTAGNLSFRARSGERPKARRYRTCSEYLLEWSDLVPGEQLVAYEL